MFNCLLFSQQVSGMAVWDNLLFALTQNLFKLYRDKTNMEDKTKVSLLFMLIGGILGIVSAFLTILGVPNSAVLVSYVAVVYATTYLYHLVGVNFDKLGEKRYRAALGGVWPSILPWLVVWTMVFYLISPVIVLAGASHAQAAGELEEYLEANGVGVKVSDDYSTHLSAHKVIILGSRESIPLGTSYGVTVFPDAVQHLLGLEKDKGTVKTEKVDSGEIITITKAMRTIIIISGSEDAIEQIVQERKETIYNMI